LENPGNPIYLNDDYANGISIESFANEGKGKLSDTKKQFFIK